MKNIKFSFLPAQLFVGLLRVQSSYIYVNTMFWSWEFSNSTVFYAKEQHFQVDEVQSVSKKKNISQSE